jgi:heptosyltransferase-2
MNIAVFLPNWVGDAVMATPALRAIRRHFDNAQIVGVLRPYVASVVEGRDWLDEMIFADGKSWPQRIPAVAWQLRRRKIDLAILFTNSFRTALISWLGGCKKRIGHALHGRSFLLTEKVSPLRDARGKLLPSPVIDAYNQLAIRAGCPAPGHRMELFTTPNDEAAADAVWQSEGLDRFAEVICLNPGAAFGASKHWPSEYFTQVARDLTRHRGSGVLVLCGPSEREQCRRIVAGADHPHVRGLHGHPLSLGLTKACVRRADLLITTDSGPRHFAAAFNRPVLSLFGATHIAWTETYFPRAVHLQKKLDCGPCQKRVCPLGHHRCMKELTPGQVFAAAVQLLATQTRSSA